MPQARPQRGDERREAAGGKRARRKGRQSPLLTLRVEGVRRRADLEVTQKFARIAQALGEDIRGLSTWQAAEKAVAAVYRLTEDLNIATLQELGFEEQEIPFLAEIAAKDPQTVGNPRDIERAGYEKVWHRAFALGK